MSELYLHNHLTRLKERFEPVDPSHVRIYVCGPTVYDLAHVGNARPEVVYDVLVRLLRLLYPRVTYVRNLTDVEDKINARAAELGIPIATLTEKTAADYRQDVSALGVPPPDVEPRATGHIPEMIEIIERLIASGHAYEAEGHVLFSVGSFANYGKFSGRNAEELLAGARVEVAPYKRDAGDFVLWKPSMPELPGWDSPWGRGRPGWHIECSAMSWRHLGETFDIHGGGTDLIFPHHENEIAQSLCAFPGSQFARYWVHNGMLLVDGEKMAKSAGNFTTLREALRRAPGEVIRLLLIRTHYRSTPDFSDVAIQEAKKELDRFYRALERNPDAKGGAVPDRVIDALCDDLILAQSCLWSRQYDCAFAEFKSILAVNPDAVQAHMLLAEALDGMNKTDDAIKELEAARQVAPNEPILHFELGYLYYKQRDYDRASPELQLEIKNNPGYAQAYLYLGDIALHMNDNITAEPFLKKAIQLQGESRLAYFDLGCVYADQNKDQEAITALQHAIKLDPTQPDAHYRLARLYLKLGQKEKAAQEFARTKELHSKTEDSLIQKVSGDNVVPR